MKIHVFSRGAVVIDADTEYQEPAVREAIEDGCNDVASVIVDYTDNERSDISHDQYAVVTGDDGRMLWKGWLTGDPDAPAPAVPCPGGCGCFLGTDDADRRECGCDSGCCDD